MVRHIASCLLFRQGALLKVVELFTGCGGLAYGLCEAGLVPVKMVEANACAHETIDANRAAGVRHVKNWPTELADVRQIDWSQFRGKVSVVAGGPPCQPFSQAGLATGKGDERDMWPEAIRAVREIEPDAFLFENVRGLMRETFAAYFASILSDLSGARPDKYTVVHAMVDAADFGAAQRRHRVIVAGFRSDLIPKVDLPEATHSRRRLLWEQWVTKSYWEEHGLPQPSEESIAQADKGMVTRLQREGVEPCEARWRTLRDVLSGLGEPSGEQCHVLQPGARSYKGHTGSDPDQPAKALKAGMHGVPGGENTVRLADGTVRYLTIREMARLQGLPDEFTFPGTWTQSTRQLGNAVPVPLGFAFAAWVSMVLSLAQVNLAA